MQLKPSNRHRRRWCPVPKTLLGLKYLTYLFARYPQDIPEEHIEEVMVRYRAWADVQHDQQAANAALLSQVDELLCVGLVIDPVDRSKLMDLVPVERTGPLYVELDAHPEDLPVCIGQPASFRAVQVATTGDAMAVYGTVHELPHTADIDLDVGQSQLCIMLRGERMPATSWIATEDIDLQLHGRIGVLAKCKDGDLVWLYQLI